MSDNGQQRDDDFLMAFQDGCDKPAILLIHGFPLNSNLWDLQFDDLDNFVRVIAPDLRGHGKSDQVPGPYTMAMLADDCADLLGYLNVATPFVVNGLSMGGYVAFEFYRRYQEHVAGLILTATRAIPDSAEAKANRDKMAEVARRSGTTAVAQAMLPSLFAPKTFERDKMLVNFVKEMMESTSVEGIIGALAAMRDRPDSTPTLAEIDVPVLIIHGAEDQIIGALAAMRDRPDSRPTLAEIDVPVLIIHGEEDQIIPLAEAETMAEAIPEAELVVIPHAGHLPNLEQPEAYNDAVIDFLESLDLEEY